MKKLFIIVFLLASFSGCSTVQDALKRHGYMDGLPNLRNKDVADVARLAEALGIDPDTITLGQLLNKADKERFKPTPTPAPAQQIILTPELLQRLIENESAAKNTTAD